MVSKKLSKRKHFFRSITLLSLFVFFVLLYSPVSAQERDGPNFTDEELTWLAEHPVIRIGVDPAYAPYSFVDDQGEYVGIAMDFMTLMSQQMGVQFEVVPELTWPEIVEGARNRSVDVIITAVQTPERDEFLDFTSIYLPTPLVIMTRSEDDQIENAADLAMKTVALVDGYSASQRVMREHPDVEPYFVATPLEGLFAVSAGNADAYIGVLGINLYLASNYGVQNLQIAAQYDLEGNGQRLAARNDWPELMPILEKALTAIPEEEKNQIFQKWIPVQFNDDSAVSEQLMLTEEEQAWLDNHPVIRVAADPNFAPIEFKEGEVYQGISVDFLNFVADELNITFEYTNPNSWQDVIAQMKSGEADLLSAAVETPERKQFATFTEPYLTLQTVIFAHEDVSFISDLSELEGQKIAVVQDFAIVDYLQRNYPDIELIEVQGIDVALAQVAEKEVLAYIGPILTTGYYIRQGNYQNIRVAGDSPYQIELAMGARQDWPMLVNILQKSLNTMSAEEQQIITGKWSAIQVEQAFDTRQVATIGLVAVAVFMVGIAWNLSLQREIRKRKQTEDALREAIHTAEFAQLEAERANQAKSTFLANMSHELRTPLNAIIGFARMMKRDSSLSPKVKKNLNIINVSGEHLLSLINDVLDMSKIEAGRVTLNNSIFNLHDMLRDIENMLLNRAQSKGLTLLFELDPDLPLFVETDEKKLRQVLINLIGNGIKFTGEGYVKIKAYAHKIERATENGRSAAKLVFEISDTGAGIGEEEIAKVFAPFEQTASGQRSGEGTGLGLPISRQFVHLMGGDIKLHSAIRQGSTFTFDIFVYLIEPALAEEVEEDVEVVGLAPGQPEYRILIVDDVQENRALLHDLLTDVGFVVREAANGQEAIDLWESWQPHLIWMDIRMSVVDGMTATTYIREHEDADQRTTIIALSSSVLEEEQEGIIAKGADAFVSKPFRELEIFERMADYLGVKYIYLDDQENQSVPEVGTLDLSSLAMDVVEKLETAVKKIDMDSIDLAIAEIREASPETADKLAYLINDYQYAVVLNEIKIARENEESS